MTEARTRQTLLGGIIFAHAGKETTESIVLLKFRIRYASLLRYYASLS